MAHANFAVISFHQHLGDNDEDLGSEAASFIFVGNQTLIMSFNIDSPPVGTGFVTLQLYDVGSVNHNIRINGLSLPGFDMPKHSDEDHWLTWTEAIPENILRQGENRIQVVRASGGDNFIVRDVIINWREEDAPVVGGPRI